MIHLQKLFEAFPVPVFISLILFAYFSSWQSALVAVMGFLFSGFKLWLSESRSKEIQSIRDEMKVMSNRIEGIQIGRSMGR